MNKKGNPKSLPKGRLPGTVNKTTAFIRNTLMGVIDDKKISKALDELYKAGDYVNYLKFALKCAELVIGKPKSDDSAEKVQKALPLPNEILQLSDDTIASIAEQLQTAMTKQKAQRMSSEANEADIIEELAEASQEH